MRRRLPLLAFCLSAVLAWTVPVSAQGRSRVPPRRPPGEPRVTLSISGGIQSAADTLTDRITFERNVETERIDVSYPDNAGVLIDIGGRVRLWKQLGIGVAVGHSVAEGTADISASIPHPFLFTQPRTVTGKQGGLSREETAVHVQVQYTIPASRRVRIVLGGGPSRIKTSTSSRRIRTTRRRSTVRSRAGPPHRSLESTSAPTSHGT